MSSLRTTQVVEDGSSMSSSRALGETASTSDLALFHGLTIERREPQIGIQASQRDMHSQTYREQDETLSETLLEEALEILRAERGAPVSSLHTMTETHKSPGGIVVRSRSLGNGPHTSEQRPLIKYHSPSLSSPSMHLLSSNEQRFGSQLASSPVNDDDSSGGDDDDEYSCESIDLPPPRVQSMANSVLGMGPNESLYREKYGALVSSRIRNSHFPLPDYRTMCNADKEREQERVLALLHRLSIRPLSVGLPTDEEGGCFSQIRVGQSQTLQRVTIASVYSQESHQHNTDQRKFKEAESMQLHQRSECHAEMAHDRSSDQLRVTQGAAGQAVIKSLADPGLVQPIPDNILTSSRGSTQKSVSFVMHDEESLILLSTSNTDEQVILDTCDPTPPLWKDVRDHGVVDTEPHTPRQPSALVGTLPLHQETSDSDKEIDVPRLRHYHLVRNGISFQSPAATNKSEELHRKRLASSSGKRGTDTSRTRSSDKTLQYGLPVQPTNQPKPFTLSSSPISPHRSHEMEPTSGRMKSPACNNSSSSDDSSFDHIGLSFGCNASSDDDVIALRQDSVSENVGTDDVSVSLRTSHSHYGGLSRDGGKQPLSDTSNGNHVQLKEGAIFHLQPLKTRPIHQKYFPDPFQIYNGTKLLPRLTRMYEKLRRREISISSKPHSIARAIVLSMEMPLIHDLVLKLVVETSNASPSTTLPPGHGNTLIVAREREQLEDWRSTFREGSSLTFLNHATLPVVQRKTRTTAEKCGKYDVVLTTYDCLKSADVTVNLDADGYVSTKDTSHESGWYSSRSTPSQTEGSRCKQLSVLHCLKWNRVAFIDTVGRKSFVVKQETGRALAARSLNSNVRFVFITDVATETDSNDVLTALIKSDRKSIESLTKILRANVESCEKDFLRHVVIDFNRHTRKKSTKAPRFRD